MVEKRIPIRVAEAVERVMKYAKHGEVEEVSITESTGGFWRGVGPDHDVPHFDRSPYDGFAIRAEDTKEASQEQPIEFEVVGEDRSRICFYSRSRGFSGGSYYDRSSYSRRLQCGRNARTDGRIREERK